MENVDTKDLLEEFMLWLSGNWDEFQNKFRRFISEAFPGLQGKLEIVKIEDLEKLSDDEQELEDEEYGDMPEQLKRNIIKDKKRKLANKPKGISRTKKISKTKKTSKTSKVKSKSE